MKMMPARQFKAECLKVMDRVHATGALVVITKRGKPVAKLVPANEPRRKVLGALRGKIRVVGGIVAPAAPAKASKALK
jgi:prevent-host-death family protein